MPTNLNKGQTKSTIQPGYYLLQMRLSIKKNVTTAVDKTMATLQRAY